MSFKSGFESRDGESQFNRAGCSEFQVSGAAVLCWTIDWNTYSLFWYIFLLYSLWRICVRAWQWLRVGKHGENVRQNASARRGTRLPRQHAERPRCHVSAKCRRRAGARRPCRRARRTARTLCKSAPAFHHHHPMGEVLPKPYRPTLISKFVRPQTHTRGCVPVTTESSKNSAITCIFLDM